MACSTEGIFDVGSCTSVARSPTILLNISSLPGELSRQPAGRNATILPSPAVRRPPGLPAKRHSRSGPRQRGVV